MRSIDDFDFLTIALFRTPLIEARNAIRRVIQAHYLPGYFDESEAVLDIGRVYERTPPSGGAHELRAVLFEPASAAGTTAMIANLTDGWMTMCNVLALQLPGEIILARSAPTQEYPLTDFQVWERGESVRYVRAMRDDSSWDFFTKGEARKFENPTHYKRRRIADRLNRHILMEYLARSGWELARSDFWQSRLPAFYLRERHVASGA